MDAKILDAVPAARRAIVDAALAGVLGAAPVAVVTPLSGGASGALIFRVESGKRLLLLRVEGPPSPLRNPHQYVSMRLAAEAGLAPKLFHVDAAAGIAITDFIVQQPLSAYPGGPGALAQALGVLLARLQATPAFPAFIDSPDLVRRLLAHVDLTGLFAAGLLDSHMEHLARLSEAHPWDPAKLVSSHNDPNPRNILFDGERLWLIDWESAYRNDPFADVAILLDNFAPTPELEAVFLKAWLGRAPDEAVYTRLALLRSLTRLYYAGVLLSASATLPREAPDTDLAAPSLADFRRARREGRLAPGTRQTIHIAGKMYLAAFLSGRPVPALDTL